MKIYRGPESKDFSDHSHELVDNRDLSSESGAWTSQKKIKVNITKDVNTRQSVAHINFEEADIIALHQGLVSGLYEKAKKTELLENEINILKSTLEKIKNKATFAAITSNTNAALNEIKNLAESALRNKNK